MLVFVLVGMIAHEPKQIDELLEDLEEGNPKSMQKKAIYQNYSNPNRNKNMAIHRL